MKANYLASPPLVVAYALAGRMDLDLVTEPIGQDPDGNDVYLHELWPSSEEISDTIASSVSGELFRGRYADVFAGDDTWRGLDTPPVTSTPGNPPRPTFASRPTSRAWDSSRRASRTSPARCSSCCSATRSRPTTSPAGSIKPDSPAGHYLVEHGVERREFNSYGSRRGNHEVMVRGTFANVRLRNLLVPGSEGTWTVHVPSGEEGSIYDVAERYRAEANAADCPLRQGVRHRLLAGLGGEGPKLLGVRAVIAESYERIHRSNLLMMGVLPLQYPEGENAESLGLTGREVFSITGVDNAEAREVTVRADDREFTARLRLDTPRERDYVRHGGILPFVLRRLLATI